MVPEAILGGAPKCGTSSLFRWLVDHPQVQGSVPKETFFLMDRDHPLFRAESNVHDHTLEGYARFFPDESAAPRVRLDGTTHYLYQHTAARVLASLPRPPVVLFLLRNPSERVYSSYQYARNNQAALRDGVTFRQFVGLASDPAAAEKTTPRLRHHLPVWKADVEARRYVRHLRRWAEVFPRSSMHILLFEEMRTDPRVFMKKVSTLLRIDAGFYDDYAFSRSNESYRVRNELLHRAVLGARRLMPAGGLRRRLRDTYFRIFTGNRPAADRDDQAVLAELDELYASDNQQLHEEFGVDTSYWARTEPLQRAGHSG